MNNTQLLHLLENALELTHGTMSEETQLLTNLPRWDSMAPMIIMAMADKQLGLHIPAKTIRKCKTVSDLIQAFGDSAPK